MKTLSWGLIGCGDIAHKRVAPALRDLPECEFAAVARRNVSLAEPFAREFGARMWHPLWRDLVADDTIEAVYIATPVDLHCEQTVAAAEAGRHVLCEKPMALTVAECDRMIDACTSAGVTLGVAYYRHFYPVVARIRELLSSGELGDVVFSQVHVFSFFDPGPDHPRAWIVRKSRAGGGPLYDVGSHRVEMLLDIFGPVSKVGGMSDRVVLERDTEDTASLILTFTSGSQSVLTVTHASFEDRDTFDIYGTHGSIHIPDLNTGKMTISTADGVRTETHPCATNVHEPLIGAFTTSVLEGQPFPVHGTAGREVNRLLAAAQSD